MSVGLENIKIISKDQPLTLKELKETSIRLGGFVKAVVDLERQKMAVGGDLHADEEVVLLEDGSVQENLWGINLCPGSAGEDFVEFDSMINIRPRQNNRSRSVESEETRRMIVKIVNLLIKDE